LMRRVDIVKWLAGLLVVAGLTAVAVRLVRKVQAQRSDQALYAEALRCEADGRHAEAVDKLRQYLAREPGNGTALAKLGDILDRSAGTPQERVRAMSVLSQVVRNDPTRQQVRRRVVAIAMDLGLLKEALPHLEALVKGSPGEAGL